MPGVCQPPSSQASAALSDHEYGSKISPKRLKVSHTETPPLEPTGPVKVWTVTNRPDYTPVIYQPYDVKFLDDHILLAEGLWPFSRIQMFDLHGHSKKVFGKGQVLPFGIAVATNSNIAVTDHKERTVKIFDLDGTQTLSWQHDAFDWPNGITMNKHGEYLIADWSRGNISKHNCQGDKVSIIKTNGNGTQDMSCPEYVIIDEHDRILVSDTFDHTVKAFSSTGDLLFQFGQENGLANIKDPRGLTLDGRGNILVADWGNNVVKRYGPNGKWIDDILTSEHGIHYPWGIDYNRDNNMLILSEQKLNSNPALHLFHWPPA